MYLIIDEQYRIYKSKVLSGYVRSQAKNAKLSVVNLNNMTGINSSQWCNTVHEDSLPEWSPVQELPHGFKID